MSKLANEAWFENNQRFGISVAMPLRLSEGRGDYRAAQLKQRQVQLAQASKQVQLQIKVKQKYIEWQQTMQQGEIQKGLVQNYMTLQRGEEMRISNGESSLFLINARELKTIESQQKLLELQAKEQVIRAQLKWAAGQYGNL